MSRPNAYRAAQAAAAALGVWTTAAPATLGYGGAAADSARIVGPIVTSLAVIALSYVTRGVRRVNALAGAWLVVSALLLEHPPGAALVIVATGLAVLATALVSSPPGPAVGGGWSALAGRRPGATP